MSHFCVLVRVPGTVQESDLHDVVAKMLVPYKESGCGSEDPPELEQYLTFHDVEDERRREYETESSQMIRLVSGEVVWAYDDRFKGPGRLQYPEGAVKFDMPHKERFALFEVFMAEYHGMKNRDPKHNRYGYWQNPNKKWDWWAIGGRWTGILQIPDADRRNYKMCWLCDGTGTRPDFDYTGEQYAWVRTPSPAGHPVIGKGCNSCFGTGQALKHPADFVSVGNQLRISQLDWNKIDKETHRRLDKFWLEWQEFCNGKVFEAFTGPRQRALQIGLIECRDMKDITGEDWRVFPWDKSDTPPEERRNRCDVLREVTKEELIQNYLDFFSPIDPWARLDAKGWQEKGEMGWWGFNDSTPDSTRQHSGRLRSWLGEGEQEDWLVVVDCHI